INKGLVVKVPYGDNKIGLSEPKVVSKYAMLWRGKGYTVFSEHIREDEDRIRLLQLSKNLNKKGYNVKWRSNARFANLAELKNDLDNLLLRYNSENFGNQGEEFYIVNISLTDKLYLDDVRKRIVNTVKFHHMLKLSYGKEVDIVEENGGSLAKLLDGLVSEFLNIEHIKADGKVLYLTGGRVLEKNIGENEYVIKLKRDLKEGGVLDGINEKITKGTYDIVEYDSEKWYQIHRYFNSENKLIGTYVNISTPPELLRGKIRYLDLEIDVVIKGSEIIVLDEDELEKKSKFMPSSLVSKAKEVLNNIVKMAKENKLT
ncbi:RNA-binding protein, partial [Sulfolobus sp. A20-N-G8]